MNSFEMNCLGLLFSFICIMYLFSAECKYLCGKRVTKELLRKLNYYIIHWVCIVQRRPKIYILLTPYLHSSFFCLLLNMRFVTILLWCWYLRWGWYASYLYILRCMSYIYVNFLSMLKKRKLLKEKQNQN